MHVNYKNGKLAAEKRLNIIAGQIEGLRAMIKNDEYCVDLLNQSLAIQNSLKSLDGVLLERHLQEHVGHQFVHEPQKAISELKTLFKRNAK